MGAFPSTVGEQGSKSATGRYQTGIDPSSRPPVAGIREAIPGLGFGYPPQKSANAGVTLSALL
jgi:hypothetical protein